MAKKLYRLHISNEKLFLLEFSRGIPQSLRQENTSKNSFHYIFPLQIPNFNFDFFCSLLHAPLFTYLSVLFPFARSTDFVYSLYHSNSFTQVPNFVLTERIYFNVTFEILVPNKKIVYCLLICCKIFVANDCFLL